MTKKDEVKILLGNEAIVQGALEEGVNFVSVYPGTPSSEIGNIFSEIAQKNGIYFEFSVNEKTAMEAGIGASYSGLKTLIAMKSFGLNVALDAFLPFVYTGTVGPTVVVVADDPSCHSSGQTEENIRSIGELAHVPILEPCDPQEAKDFLKIGFEISQNFGVPVILRTTTRVAHQKMPVKIGEVKSSKKNGKFLKNTKKFVTMPPRVLEMKKELLEKIEKIKNYSEKSEINKIIKGSSDKIGIIASGVSYLYVMEVLSEFGLSIPVLKVGIFNPLPSNKIKAFIKNKKKILVAEELEGFIEKEVKVLAKETNCNLSVFGKDILLVIGELNAEKIADGISKISGKKLKYPTSLKNKNFNLNIPSRYPALCQGCPYWIPFSILKQIAPKGTVFGGDIGCYMLAGFPPHEIQDYLLCMGSSIGIGHGIKKALQYNSGQASDNNQKLIALIGDSTFFHSGIPALINTVYNKSNPLIIVMDNRITAMTGHQPNPGMSETGMGETSEEIDIEKIVRACGVKNVRTIDPVNAEEFKNTVKEFLDKNEVSVIISKKICAYYARKKGKK